MGTAEPSVTMGTQEAREYAYLQISPETFRQGAFGEVEAELPVMNDDSGNDDEDSV